MLSKYEDGISVVLADDHEIVRAGIRRLLSVDRSIKLIDEASNGRDFIDIVKYHKPDVALCDIMMPLLSGIDAVRILKEEFFTDTYIIMLTAYEDSFHLEGALKAGADGYLSKDINSADLLKAIHDVMEGERVFSKSVIKLLNNESVVDTMLESSPVSITKREQEVLNLVAKGKTSQEIADLLFVSVRTIEAHRYNLMQKLNIKNTAELIRYALTQN